MNEILLYLEFLYIKDYSIEYLIGFLCIFGLVVLVRHIFNKKPKEKTSPVISFSYNYQEIDMSPPLKKEEDKLPIEPESTPLNEISIIEPEVHKNIPAATDKEPIVPVSYPSFEPYEPTLDLRDYKYPSLDLFELHGSEKIVQDASELEANKILILNTLENYGIAIQDISATVGPNVTLFEMVPVAGVRISKIKNLEDDIVFNLVSLGIRMIVPIPGKAAFRVEVPNGKQKVVSMKTLLASEKFQNNAYNLPIAIGKKIDNENFIVDLTVMPHLLISGATGQGKSVGLNAILVSLLYRKHPSQLKLVLVDTKKVELSVYRTIEKHFLAKLPGEEESIISESKKAIHTLNALCIEMDNRYDLLREAGTRNIKEYNDKFIKRKLNPQKGHQYLPFIVLVIDEYADLVMTVGKEVEMPIARLAQLARAVGIHLIIVTQRPTANIITGTIKANFSARIAFKMSSKIDSRTILDMGGAEQLLGKGDMLIAYNGEVTRLQCAFVDTLEVEKVTDFIGDQRGYPQAFLLPEHVDEKELAVKNFDINDRDALFEDAARLIVQNQIGSTSLLQRRMKLGYNRTGRLPRTLINRTHGYKVNFLISASETSGKYTYVEVDLPPGEGTPLHYHLHFDEQFEAIEGVLGIQLGKEKILVHPGDKPAAAPRGFVHRFFNPGTDFIKFRAVISPARQFETVMRITYGLADDGLCNSKGMPKNIFHLALVYEIGESFLPGLPLIIQRSIFGVLAKIARLKGKDKELKKYYTGQIEPQINLDNKSNQMSQLQPLVMQMQ